MFLLTLALTAHYSSSLAIVTKVPVPDVARTVQAQMLLAHGTQIKKNVKMDTSHKATTNASKVDPVLIRPNAGKGVDTVTFALQVLNFYGTSLKKHTIALDMSMSFRWKDPPVVPLIPAGLQEISIAWSQALDLIWMPGIVVTNRDIEKYEIISASVTIFRTGEVLRVERAQAIVMKKFDLASYPFDTQHLEVKIGSSKYMLNEVVLVANNSGSGVNEHIFGLYDVQGYHAEAFETRDGHLKKSRGKLSIEVKRQLDKYVDDHLVPTCIVLMISWSVFFFPFEKPFITPRLALSILALLQFTNLMVKSTKELPGAAPFNWNDLFNQQIQTFMFITIVLNIACEIVCHQFEMEKEARRMNNEAKVFVPCISLLNIILILGSANYGWMSVDRALHITKSSALLLVGCYGYYVWREVSGKKWFLQEEKEAIGSLSHRIAGLGTV